MADEKAHRKELVERLSRNSCSWFEGRMCHPEVAAIDRMIQLIRQVLLPNYFASTNVDALCEQMTELREVMAGQIHRALFKRCLDLDSTEQSRSLAEARTDTVLDRLPEVQEMLYEDVCETYHDDPAATGYDEIILTYPGLYALLVYRVAHIMVELDIPFLPRMITEHAHQVTGIDLHPGATIGRHIMIDHGTGIVVGETATVGDHVKIYQGVTLGALYFPRDESGSMLRKTKRHPTVEDYVVLYAHATVLGGDTVIGHHSVIGSNAWVTESVPPYSKALYQAETVVHTRA